MGTSGDLGTAGGSGPGTVKVSVQNCQKCGFEFMAEEHKKDGTPTKYYSLVLHGMVWCKRCWRAQSAPTAVAGPWRGKGSLGKRPSAGSMMQDRDDQ